MTEVRIRNVDDWVVDWFRQQARREGRSLENALRDQLTKLALSKKREIADEFRSMRAELSEKYGAFSDSTLLIREDRDARG